MLLQPVLTAAATISAGEMLSPSIGPVSRAAWLICQFWQNAQRKLQPMAAMEKLRLPG